MSGEEQIAKEVGGRQALAEVLGDLVGPYLLVNLGDMDLDARTHVTDELDEGAVRYALLTDTAVQRLGGLTTSEAIDEQPLEALLANSVQFGKYAERVDYPRGTTGASRVWGAMLRAALTIQEARDWWEEVQQGRRITGMMLTNGRQLSLESTRRVADMQLRFVRPEQSVHQEDVWVDLESLYETLDALLVRSYEHLPSYFRDLGVQSVNLLAHYTNECLPNKPALPTIGFDEVVRVRHVPRGRVI